MPYVNIIMKILSVGCQIKKSSYYVFMSQNKFLSWDDIHFDAQALAKIIEQGGYLENCKGLIAVARGGLVPTGILSSIIDIRMIESVCLASYKGKEQGDLQVFKSLELDNEGEGWLFIDDLVDSGETFAFLRALLPKAKRCCLYTKPEGKKNVDIYVREVPQDTWLHFPWELED